MENAGDGANAEQQMKEKLPSSFLRKTYDLLDDPETNSLISWNSNGKSLIVWDHNKFSVELQNKHFKSNNFASFVSQLNNYGFRKISYDRYEYAHRWFQSGQRHLLKNIKRKKPPSELKKKRNHSTVTKASPIAKMATELNDMKAEQNDMKRQIQNLKNSMDNMAYGIETLKAHKNSVPELNDETTNIVDLLKQLVKEKGDFLSGDNSKKPKLITAGESESSTEDQMAKKANETAAGREFWDNLFNDEKERHELNAKQGDLADQHAKAMMVLDEMMESEIAVEKENLIAKPFDQNEEDGQVELWM